MIGKASDSSEQRAVPDGQRSIPTTRRQWSRQGSLRVACRPIDCVVCGGPGAVHLLFIGWFVRNADCGKLVMPIVFVHGVSVRDTDEYYAAHEKLRNEYFRQISLRSVVGNGQSMRVFNPYWGDDAVKFAWDRDSLPSQRIEQFGGSSELIEAAITQAAIQLPEVESIAEDQLLPVLASRSMIDAINLLWTVAGISEEDADKASELATTARNTLAYAEAHPKPGWLGDVKSNEQFVERLIEAVDSWQQDQQGSATESFGLGNVWNTLTHAADNVVSGTRKVVRRAKDAVTDAARGAVAGATNPLVRLVRPSLNEGITIFFGDVFHYFRCREKHREECPIVKAIAAAFREAAAQRSSDDPLIIVGHSLGGVISYDLLSSFLVDEIHCDLFLTVGSQVALFEEMKLYEASDPAKRKGTKIGRPASIHCWTNVFDHADVFSYQTEPVFDGVNDFEYSTGETVVAAHSAYLLQPAFHNRLHERIKGAIP